MPAPAEVETEDVTDVETEAPTEVETQAPTEVETAAGVVAPAPLSATSAVAPVGLARVRPKRELRRRRVAWTLVVLLAVAVVVAAVLQSTKSTTPVDLAPVATKTVLQLPATSVVSAVAEGDGAGFAADAQRDLLIRFDPATGRTEASVTLPGRPGAMLLHGNELWVTDTTHNAVTEVDATTLKVEGSAGLSSTPTSLATWGDDLWVSTNNVSEIARVSLITGVVYKPVAVLSGAVRVTDGFGAVWATGTVNRLTRIVPSATGGVPAQSAVQVGKGPTSVATGPDAIWVLNSESATVSRVDPNSLAVVATYKVGAGPDSIAVAPNGHVLVGFSAGTVVDLLGIDAKSQTLEVGTHPQDLAAASAGVWVAGADPGQVVAAG